tara:strand:- start:2555 stop:3334 length:780 start_codon:yes stop_codon:yes gene_type:complete
MAAQSNDSYTLSYSESSKGWPSFYSYLPDMMVGMNSYFYSFRNGDLYRHNTNTTRNNYYNEQFLSEITSVFNVEPQTIKLFKTMSYESDTAWTCTSLFTELSSGSMLDTYFVQKEREWFTYLRANENTINFSMRSANGIGTCSTITGVPGALIVQFPISPGSILSVGDYVYATTAAIYFGQVTNVDRVNNTITVDESVNSPQGIAGVVPANNVFIVFIKNAVAASSGARGYFMQFTLTNSDTIPVELFSIGSSVMKSFP